MVETAAAGAHRGRGEAVPSARYGETPEGVAAAVEALRGAVEAGFSPAARCGRPRPTAR